MEDDDDNEFFTEDFERYFTESDEQPVRAKSIYKDHDESGHGRRDFE